MKNLDKLLKLTHSRPKREAFLLPLWLFKAKNLKRGKYEK
jgi:hypothetical protein